jgi:hypothetical protein
MSKQVIKKYDYIEENENESLDNRGQSRCFCITLLNYTDDDIIKFRKMEQTYKLKCISVGDKHISVGDKCIPIENNSISVENKYSIKYICFWTDINNNGVRYLQGVVQFTNRIITSKVSIIYNGCRVVKTRGAPDNKDTYKNFEEYGNSNRQGNKKQIEK